MQTEDKRIRIDGLTFRIRLDGADGAPWIVFSNSLLTDLSLWDEQAFRLRDRYRVLRYDQRGHGGTDIPTEPCTLERLAEDVVAILDHVGVTETAYVGLSMGAATGLVLSARHPGRLNRLMLCDSPARSPPNARQAWEYRISLARAHGMDALVEATLRRWLDPGNLGARDAWLPKLRTMMLATSLDGFAACAGALMDFDATRALGHFGGPTALLVGQSDGVLPQAMQAMAEQVRHASVHVIEKAGHMPNLEQPALFQACLDRFITS